MFCVDKPLGWTSFAVVKKVRGTWRKRLGTSTVKVGTLALSTPLPLACSLCAPVE